MPIVILIVGWSDFDVNIATHHSILDCFIWTLDFERFNLFGQGKTWHPVHLLDEVDNSGLLTSSLWTIKYHMLLLNNWVLENHSSLLSP